LRGFAIIHANRTLGHVDEDELLPFLIQTLPSDHKRLVEIDLPNLVYDMIDAFYTDHPSETAARNFRWSLGSGDLPSFVYNYITTQDCFLRTLEGLHLSVNVSIDCVTMPVLAVSAYVAWQPPDIEFRSTALQHGPRGQNDIALRCEQIFGEPGSSSYKRFPNHVEFAVKQYKTKGNIPTVAETLVQASTVTQFPEDVRFERVSRYAVKGKVVEILQVGIMPDKHRLQLEEPLTPWVPSYTSTPLSKTRPLSISPRPCYVDALGRLRRVFLESHSTQNRDPEEAAWKEVLIHEVIPSDPDLQSGSPKKRKSSMRSASSDEKSTLKVVDQESDTCLKRQKLQLPDELSMPTINVIDLQKSCTVIEEPAVVVQRFNATIGSPDSLYQSVESEHPEKRRHSDGVRRMSLATAHTAADIEQPWPKDNDHHAILMEKEKSVALPPTPGIRSQDPVLRSPTPIYLTKESDYSDASAPNSASNASDLDAQKSGHGIGGARLQHYTELSQDEIQKNYREFEEVAKRRMTDPTSRLVSDVGDMNFERIFLGDSEVEDWNFEDIDGLSEGMSGLEMDEN
jgi:hypothetical protein